MTAIKIATSKESSDLLNTSVYRNILEEYYQFPVQNARQLRNITNSVQISYNHNNYQRGPVLSTRPVSLQQHRNLTTNSPAFVPSRVLFANFEEDKSKRKDEKEEAHLHKMNTQGVLTSNSLESLSFHTPSRVVRIKSRRGTNTSSCAQESNTYIEDNKYELDTDYSETHDERYHIENSLEKEREKERERENEYYELQYKKPQKLFTSPLDKKNFVDNYQKKFKTELCKNFEAYGRCKFGNKCSFAHGGEEIRKKSHLPDNYKSRLCKQFHQNMYCPYGNRCQFLHTHRCREKTQVFSYKLLLEENLNYAKKTLGQHEKFEEILRYVNKNPRHRLPEFVKLTSQSRN